MFSAQPGLRTLIDQPEDNEEESFHDVIEHEQDQVVGMKEIEAAWLIQ